MPEVTGVGTSTSTSSATSTSGGVVTDYRYALRAEAGPDSSWATANPLNSAGEYYEVAGTDANIDGNDADGNAIVYVQLDDAVRSDTIVVTAAEEATSEEYVVRRNTTSCSYSSRYNIRRADCINYSSNKN